MLLSTSMHLYYPWQWLCTLSGACSPIVSIGDPKSIALTNQRAPDSPNLEREPQFGYTSCGCEFFSQLTFPATNTLLEITEIKRNLMYHYGNKNVSLNINDGLCK